MRRRNNSIYGILAITVFLSAASAISLACLGRASNLSRTAYAQDVGIVYMQTAADLAVRDHGVLDAAAESVGTEIHNDGFEAYYDRDMEPCGQDAACYVIRSGNFETDGLFGSVDIELADLRSGDVLIRIPAAWCFDGSDDFNNVERSGDGGS